jgi:uroporphyrinogen decarboxylase
MPLDDSVFLRACRGEKTPYTPIWLMRQAGRYMPEYRAVRERVSMLELCKRPDLVSEVTVFAAAALGVDAAILFSDLLVLAEPMGLALRYDAGEGPRLDPPIRDAGAIDRLCELGPENLAYVYEGVRRTRADLPGDLPLIGFAGAPFTLASYFVEGGSSRHFEHTKRLYRTDEGAFAALMEKLSRALVLHLNAQIDAGVQAVQIFDSWVGCLSPADYRRHALRHTHAVIEGLRPGVPVIHFGTGNAGFLEDFATAGGDVIGVDWRVDLDQAWRRVGAARGIMGNLDPLALFGPLERLEADARAILDRAAGRPGHIFNLGHGVLPGTPVDHVRRLVDVVHEASAQR